MKYKIALVLVFSCIIGLFGSEKTVKGLSFTFYNLPENLMPNYKIGSQKVTKDALNNTSKQWIRKISYEIFFKDGTVEKKEILGEVKELVEKKDDIEKTLRDVLKFFNKREGMDEVNEQVFQEINASEEEIKNNYIKENKEHWKQKYTEQNAEAWKNEYETQLKNQKKNEKKSLIERLKDPGLVLLGAGLGFGFDRYMLKK